MGDDSTKINFWGWSEGGHGITEPNLARAQGGTMMSVSYSTVEYIMTQVILLLCGRERTELIYSRWHCITNIRYPVCLGNAKGFPSSVPGYCVISGYRTPQRRHILRNFLEEVSHKIWIWRALWISRTLSKGLCINDVIKFWPLLDPHSLPQKWHH